MLPRLVRAIRATRPDLVHVHSRRGADLYGGLAAVIADAMTPARKAYDFADIALA